MFADSSLIAIKYLTGSFDGNGHNIFWLKKKYKEAIPYFEKAFMLLNGASIMSWHKVTFLTRFYLIVTKKTGDYAKASTNYKIAANMEDSKETKSTSVATELSMNYDSEKKQGSAGGRKERDDEIAKTNKPL